MQGQASAAKQVRPVMISELKTARQNLGADVLKRVLVGAMSETSATTTSAKFKAPPIGIAVPSLNLGPEEKTPHFFLISHRIEANPEKSDLVNFWGPD